MQKYKKTPETAKSVFCFILKNFSSGYYTFYKNKYNSLYLKAF